MRRIRRGEGEYEGSEDELTRPREDWLSAIPLAAMTSLLLIYPGAARKVIKRTVDNYALPGEAAERIRKLPLSDLEACFD